VLIVLTDGNDTGSMVPADRAAEIARDSGVTIYTVAMGDPEASGESALDEETLESVAEITGGDYFHASDREELENIYRRLDELNPRKVETTSYRPKRELFQWPLGFSLSLALLLMVLGELGSRKASSRQATSAPLSS
jgi:Ca-activated chloride channel family protein